MYTPRKDSGQIKVKTQRLKTDETRNEGNYPYSSQVMVEDLEFASSTKASEAEP